MKKLFTKTMLLLCALVAGSASVWAADDKTIESNFTDKDLTVGEDELVWTATNVSQYEKSGSARGVQSNKNTTNFVFTSDATQTAALGTIKKVVVTASANANQTIAISVGGKTFATSQSLPNKSANVDFTFSGSASGQIVITISRTSSSTAWVKKIVVTYEEASKDPVINASNVDYAADITNGEIAYTITNPVEGKSLTAETTADWITLGDVTSTAVPFTMTENTGTEREGTITLKYDGATDKAITVTQAAAVVKYAVTFDAPANGTLVIKRDGNAIASGAEIPTGTELTIEATPARGYSLTSWEYKAGDGEWTTGDGATYTVTSAVAFRATFAELAKYTVTLGDDSSKLTEEYGGEGVTLPSRAATAGYTFAGWSADEIAEETTTVPAVVFAGEYFPTSNIILYPVYTRAMGGTATHTVNIGEYAEANSWTTTNGGGPYLSVAVDNQVTVSVSSGNSNGKVYTNNNKVQWRVYTNGTLTITSSKDNIKSITISNTQSSDFGLKYGEVALKNGTAIEVTPSKSVDLSVTGTTRITDMVIVTDNSVAYYTSHPVPTTGTITLNSACNDGSVIYGTYYTDRAYVMPENMVGQVVSVDNDGKLTVQDAYEEDDVVPAKTALLLYTIEDFEGTKDYTITYTNEDGADWSSENMLKGTLTADEMTEGDDCLFYRLTMHNGKTIGFWWGAAKGAAFKPGAHKAYLAVPESVVNARLGFAFGEDSETTGIEWTAQGQTTGLYYDLQGRRVAQSAGDARSTGLKKGLYIVNGKKVIVK